MITPVFRKKGEKTTKIANESIKKGREGEDGPSKERRGKRKRGVRINFFVRTQLKTMQGEGVKE